MASLFVALQMPGQSDTIYQLPDIVIKENRIALPFSETSRAITIITVKQIEQLPVQSVNELLLNLAGVDVRRRGPNGVQADIGIRGGTFDQTLVLINGVKMSDPQTGHHIMNLPLNLDNIERVEVLKGPGARIYGQNAFSGAINIVTKTPDTAFLKVSAQAGQNELGGIQFSAAFPQGNLNQYVSFGKSFSSGYQYNTDYDITNIFYQNEVSNGNHQLGLMAGYTERRFGANGFYASPEFMDQYEEIQTSIAAINYEWTKDKWRINPRFYWRRNQDEYIFVRSNPSLYRNLHIGNTYGIEVHASHVNKLGKTGIGVETASVMLNSNNLGKRDRLQGSLFLEHRFQLMNNALDITPGFSVNHFSDFGTKVFPGIDLGFRINNQIKFFANTGYTYRVPTFTDLYYEDPANLGNPDLQPEEAFAYEAGVKYNQSGIQLQASYFFRRGFDLIDWTRAADSLQWQPSNINELDTRGLDFNAEAYFPVLLGTSSVLQRIGIGYTYIDTQLEDNEAVLSRYVLENLDHQLTAKLEYRIGKHFHHSIAYRYTSRVTMDDYSVVDTRLAFRRASYACFAEARNLFDEEYRETNLVVMPGRWISVGFEYTFKQ